MKKTIRIAIPTVIAYLVLSGLFWVVGSGRASTGASPNLPQATIIVNTLEDETIVDGNCSLREAFIASDSNIQVDACTPGQAGITDTITFDMSGTIHLSSQLGLVWNGATVVDGGGVIILDGGGTTSLIGVDTNTYLKIIGMNLTNGYAPYYGGAISNNGTIEIVDSTISASFAGDTGGGINNSGNLTIEGTTITGNHASGGGGISNNYMATLTVIDSVLSGNSASSGGAIGTGNYSMAVISNCEFTDNHADIQGGGIGNSGSITVTNSTLTGNSGGNQGGGGFSNTGTMTISGTSLSGNQASGGGCLVNGGQATILDSVFDNNGAPGNPGCIKNYDGSISIQRVTVSNTEGNAILNMPSFNPNTIEVVDSVLIGNSDSAINNNGEMTVTQSTIADNSAWSGGGIFNHHEMNISESTVSGNSVETQGGGIYNDGSLIMKNSAVSGNNAQYGAAIYLIAPGDTNISFSTIAGNSNPTGAAVYNEHGDLIFDNSILYNPDTQDECYSPVAMIDGGHNISSDSTCNFDPANGSMPNTDPLIGPLQDNGGPTLTHALLPDSPAIDAGNDDQCPSTDQRGIIRPQDGDGDGISICDIGSFELESPWVSPTLVTISGPGEGVIDQSYLFRATVEPISTSLPLEYIWQVDGQVPITQTGGLTDTISFIWEMPSTHVITVTASNMGGEVSVSHVITITIPIFETHLPLVIKSAGTPLGNIFSSSSPEIGVLLGLIPAGIVGMGKRRG